MQAIYDAGGELVFAGTLLDTLAQEKSGRVYLDSFCAHHSIPLVKFRNINDPDAVAAIRQANLDWLMIIGWSQIAKGEVLGAPRLGVLGIHPTLLPVGRGRAAVPWAILLNLTETGVTLFKLDGGIDTGPVIAQVRLSLDPRETSTSLYRRVNDAHRSLILENWSRIANGDVALVPQRESLATEWAGRRPEQGRLSQDMSVEDADRLIRAVTRPYPGAFMDVDGRRLRIWRAEPLTGAAAGEEIPRSVAFKDGFLHLLEAEWEPIP
jgi:methionyl-tRNA formyltransferase